MRDTTIARREPKVIDSALCRTDELDRSRSGHSLLGCKSLKQPRIPFRQSLIMHDAMSARPLAVMPLKYAPQRATSNPLQRDDVALWEALRTLDTTPLHPERAELPHHFEVVFHPYAPEDGVGAYVTLLWKVAAVGGFTSPAAIPPDTSTDTILRANATGSQIRRKTRHNSPGEGRVSRYSSRRRPSTRFMT